MTVVHFRWTILLVVCFCYILKHLVIWNLLDDICGLRLIVGALYLDIILKSFMQHLYHR